VGGLQVLDLLRALREIGVESDAVCRAIGLATASLTEAARVPSARVATLLIEAERRTRDALVGLHAGERAEPRGPLAYLMLSSPSLEEGVRRAARFVGLAMATLRLDVTVQREHLILTFDLGDGPLARNRQAVDYVLMAFLRTMQRATVGTVVPREVHVRYRDAGGGPEADRAFGCPVHSGRPGNRLIFRRRELQTASTVASTLISEQIEKFAAAQLARVTRSTTMRSRVEDVLRSLLTAGVATDRPTVARRLAMSERSLQRALETEHTSFRAIRDDTLAEVSKALLSNASLKVEAVALSVGFADVAAFSKAFSRWTGTPPTRYRARFATRSRRPSF